MSKMGGRILFLTLYISLLHANSNNKQLQDFKSLLNEVSTIATQKSINVDYMPAVVTVLQASTLLDAGVQNVSQALDMLPGIQEQVSPMGYTITTVRGFKTPNAYYADKMRILVDGVPINNDVSGTANFYLDFPMQLISKIEVLRGPASTMYGGGAFYGAVNIITKLGDSQKENQLYLSGGSYGTIAAGTDLYTTTDGWNIFVDGYVTSNDKSLYFDSRHNGPGFTDEAKKDYSVGLKATQGGWAFLTRLKHENSGNFYSFEGGLNPIPSRPEDHADIYLFSQLSYKTNVNGYQIKTKLHYSHREQSVNANLFSVSEEAGDFATVGLNFQDGFYSIENLTEDKYGFNSSVNLPHRAANDILVGVGASYDVVTQDDYFSSVENEIAQNETAIVNSAGYNNFRYRADREPAYWLDPTATRLFPKGISRTNVYVYAQDLISMDQKMDLILGLRGDYYSDTRSELSKRVGFVYRADDTTTLKLLYGSAFRAPTFTEKDQLGHINLRMGNKKIQPEECNTYEAQIIYTPNFYNKFALNVYYTQLHNVIDLEELDATPIGYKNYPDRKSKGVEFEYFFKTNMRHNFYFNLSYTDTDYITPPDGNSPANADPSIQQNMPDISPFMAKAIYVYRPTQKLSFGTTWRYFSATTATKIPWVVQDVNAGLYKSSVPAVNIFNETLTYRFTATSELRGTVDNLFNATVLQPAYYYDSAYDGIQREGRNYLISYVQKF